MPENKPIKARIKALVSSPVVQGTVFVVGITAIVATGYIISRKNSNAYIAHLQDIRDQYDVAFAETIQLVAKALNPE